MTPELAAEVFIAHLLAAHLSVPEPVLFDVRELWPSENCAQVRMAGPPGAPAWWMIEYDSTCWERRPEQREAVLAHEVCHAAYDYREAWSSLSREDRKRAHKRVKTCVRQILRDHRRCR